MFDLADSGSEFEACVILRRGCEGSLGLSLARPGELTCGVRRADGKMERLDFRFGPKDAGVTQRSETDQQCPPLSPEATAAKIEAYANTGSSGDGIFDDRVDLTLKAFDAAFDWIYNSKVPKNLSSGPSEEE
mmetsp:Transcript_18116/g.28074  ORF Transcript_18116/g.28074 Transcript_18116/m.28074 type:complete len:132 (+) Transcript_18116:154-549(+)|eukprot:CAMPEP_0184310868 /NCGR_PEP_ID=MMETSP1049-20130417/35477_1 /TAXON_ID=77928 /ORGANISM="Proteomonas sulcata, Strain CCMP704" /LENGTH=131 /DNA_ID=CAMNT_0026625611 /DNA_START=182 /DNA_END=577 /DNA_ORIENTATION=+